MEPKQLFGCSMKEQVLIIASRRNSVKTSHSFSLSLSPVPVKWDNDCISCSDFVKTFMQDHEVLRNTEMTKSCRFLKI